MAEIDFLKFINDAGIIGLLAFIIIAGMKQWWVFGWIYRDVDKEKELWRTLALRGTSLAEKSIEIQAKKNDTL